MKEPEVVNEGMLDMVSEFMGTVDRSDFKSIWDLLHYEDKSRVFGIYFGKESEEVYGDFAEKWIMNIIDENFTFDSSDYEGVGSNVKVNEYGVKYLLLTETERIGEVWTKPTPVMGVPIHFKEDYTRGTREYKIKLFSDDFPNEFNSIYQ